MDACNFNALFPGIQRSVATLTLSFKIPLFREWILAHGFVSCGGRTLRRILEEPGRAVVLVPGGANEALYSHPGTFKVSSRGAWWGLRSFLSPFLFTSCSLLVHSLPLSLFLCFLFIFLLICSLHSHQVHLLNRKGFIRIAIQSGASVVPAIGFGENELFHTVDNETPGLGRNLYKLQVLMMKHFSFSAPVVTNLLPKREKVVVVMGQPISTKGSKCSEPSQELIDRIHKEYCEQVERVWNEHKDLYGKGIPFEIA